MATAPVLNERLYCAGGAADFRIRSPPTKHRRIKGKRLPFTLFAGNRRARIRAASPSRGLSRSPISEIYFVRWRASAARPNTRDFFLALFFLALALRRRPMAVGRSRRELAGDPHQPAVGQFVLAIFAAARGDRTRPPAPLSNGVNGDSTRLERAPLLRWWCR